MADKFLNSLLKEYEQKKIKAEYDAEKRKDSLYNTVPRLKEIEDELNHFAISTAKNILQNNDVSCTKLQETIEKLKAEKIKILLSLNLSEDYLKPIYDCKLCNDTGYITSENYKTTMCNCLKQRILNESFNKSNISNLNKENFKNFNENLFSDEVDIAKYNFNISPKKNIMNIKNQCMKFVENFDNPEQKNLLFVGNSNPSCTLSGKNIT